MGNSNSQQTPLQRSPSRPPHPTLLKVVFLHQIFKFIPSFYEIDEPKVLRRFFEFASVHPEWREFLFFYRSPRLFLDFSEATDAVLKSIANLTTLEFLGLNATKITDAGLQHIAGLTNLTELSLGNIKISGSGLQHLVKLENLTDLRLDGSFAHDVGLQYITNLPLRKLWLSSTYVTSLGLPHVGKITSLEELVLGPNISIGSEGAKQLANLKSLIKLDLHGSRVTDIGLQHLADLVLLEELDLRETDITSAGLKHLEKLQRLRKIDLYCCQQIGDEGMKHLAKILSLEELDLQRTQVSGIGLQYLLDLPHLDATKVNAHSTFASTASIEAFKTQLLENQAKLKIVA